MCMQVYSLIASRPMKTYHPTLHVKPWSMNLLVFVSFQLHGEHTVLQPFRRIELTVHIFPSVLPGTILNLSQVRQLGGGNIIFLWKYRTKRDAKPHGRQRHRQSVTL